MAQVSEMTESVAEPIDRISIPFFQIQERRWLLAGVDVFLVAGWMALAYRLWHDRAHPRPGNIAHLPIEWVIGAACVWLAFAWLAGAYELDAADKRGAALKATAAVSVLAFIAALVTYSLFLKTYPRPALALDVVAIPLSIALWRMTYATVLARPAYAMRLLLVGDALACDVLTAAAGDREPYYRLLGFVAATETADPRYWGESRRLLEVAVRNRVHRVVIGPRQDMSDGLTAAICSCIELGIEVMDFNTAYEEITGKLAVDHVGDRWLASLPTRPNSSRLEEAAIRLLDIGGALVGLALTAVLGPVISLGILLESGFPIFYRQVRLGQGGKPFAIYKFRSMRADAESDGARWAANGDRRATRVGSYLRRAHLDELPQFWNVLRGEMSLVGPRPERPEFTEELSHSIPFYRLRLAVRPGLTGLKQIRVGYAATPEEHLEVLRHDLYYIKHRSLALNIQLMARTAAAVCGMEGR